MNPIIPSIMVEVTVKKAKGSAIDFFKKESARQIAVRKAGGSAPQAVSVKTVTLTPAQQKAKERIIAIQQSRTKITPTVKPKVPIPKQVGLASVTRADGTTTVLKSTDTAPPKPTPTPPPPQSRWEKFKTGITKARLGLKAQEDKSMVEKRPVETFLLGGAGEIVDTVELVTKIPELTIAAGKSGRKTIQDVFLGVDTVDETGLKTTTSFFKKNKEGFKKAPKEIYNLGKGIVTSIVDDAKQNPVGFAGGVFTDLAIGYAIGGGIKKGKAKIKPKVIDAVSEGQLLSYGDDIARMGRGVQKTKIGIGNEVFDVTSDLSSIAYKGGKEVVETSAIKSVIKKGSKKPFITTGEAVGYFKSQGDDVVSDIIGKTKITTTNKGKWWQRTKIDVTDLDTITKPISQKGVGFGDDVITQLKTTGVARTKGKTDLLTGVIDDLSFRKKIQIPDISIDSPPVKFKGEFFDDIPVMGYKKPKPSRPLTGGKFGIGTKGAKPSGLFDDIVTPQTFGVDSLPTQSKRWLTPKKPPTPPPPKAKFKILEGWDSRGVQIPAPDIKITKITPTVKPKVPKAPTPLFSGKFGIGSGKPSGLFDDITTPQTFGFDSLPTQSKRWTSKFNKLPAAKTDIPFSSSGNQITKSLSKVTQNVKNIFVPPAVKTNILTQSAKTTARSAFMKTASKQAKVITGGITLGGIGLGGLPTLKYTSKTKQSKVLPTLALQTPIFKTDSLLGTKGLSGLGMSVTATTQRSGVRDRVIPSLVPPITVGLSKTDSLLGTKGLSGLGMSVTATRDEGIFKPVLIPPITDTIIKSDTIKIPGFVPPITITDTDTIKIPGFVPPITDTDTDTIIKPVLIPAITTRMSALSFPILGTKKRQKPVVVGSNGWVAEGLQHSTKPKQKGWVKLNKTPYLTKQGALDRGAYAVDNTVSNKFRVKQVSTKGAIKSQHPNYFQGSQQKFRTFKITKGVKVPLVNTFIERKGQARIDTGGEIRGLSLAKLLKQPNFGFSKKSKKSNIGGFGLPNMNFGVNFGGFKI